MVGLAGCASLVAPKTVQQRLAYAQAGIDAVRLTAADLLGRGRISIAAAERVQAEADRADLLIDDAYLFAKDGLMNAAEGKLDLALRILTALERELQQ